MNLVDSLAVLRDKLQKVSLVEAKGHMDHPEDLVFLQGTTGVQRAIQAMLDTVKNPQNISIKWDGYPALIWGYGPDGKFSVMDKHMFNKGVNSPARYIHSPEAFAKYDQERGVNRIGLHEILYNIWDDLKAATPKKPGYYWGDLLFSQKLQPQSDGLYHFQANPEGIKYTVDPTSDVGKKYFNNKNAGIVVHQTIPNNANSTDDSVLLNGTTGGLQQGKSVSILPASMPVVPKLKLDKNLLNKALSSEREYGSDLDEFFSKPPQALDSFTNLFTSYINKKIVSRNLSNLVDGFFEYVNSRPMTDSMRKKLLGYDDTNTKQHVPGYLDGNRDKIAKIFKIWIDIYNLKMNLVPQLDSAAETAPVQGYLKDGTRTQEGFVSQGLKLVNRMGFSAQNLAGRS